MSRRRRVSKKVHTTEMAPVVEASLPEIAQTSASEFWIISPRLARALTHENSL